MSKVFTCDCCMKQVDTLTDLKDEYAPPHIKELCQDCLKALEKFSEPRLKAIMSEHAGLVREFLVTRRAEVA